MTNKTLQNQHILLINSNNFTKDESSIIFSVIVSKFAFILNIDNGFISPLHLQIATDLQKKMPNLFGKYNLGKFWGLEVFFRKNI